MKHPLPPHGDIAFTVRKLRAGAGSVSLSFSGDLDVSSVELLTAWIDHICGRGFRQVILDLSGLTFADCAGVRALAASCRRLRQHCGRVEISGATYQVQRVLDLARLTLNDQAKQPTSLGADQRAAGPLIRRPPGQR